MASAADPAIEAWVKGDPATSTLGDCPFCHRVLLTLEEKQVPYTKGYVDFAAKPDWLLEVNPAGSVPVAKDLRSSEWVVDSGVIVDYLEEQFPQPALGTVESSPNAGGKVFPAFVAFFKSVPGSDEAAEKEAALLGELRALEAYLQANGPYVGGKSVCATDCSLAPKLHHMIVALKGLKGWQLPAEFTAIAAYMDAMRARPSWAASYYPDELILKGWQPKLPAA